MCLMFQHRSTFDVSGTTYTISIDPDFDTQAGKNSIFWIWDTRQNNV